MNIVASKFISDNVLIVQWAIGYTIAFVSKLESITCCVHDICDSANAGQVFFCKSRLATFIPTWTTKESILLTRKYSLKN